MVPPRLKKPSVNLPPPTNQPPGCHLAPDDLAPQGESPPLPRASHQPQPLWIIKQPLFVGLTIVANWKLGGGGCAPKRAIKHLEREYKEIGGAYKVPTAQVFQIEPAPELRPWLNARPNSPAADTWQ